MTIDEARKWLQHHADNTPMPGAREAYKTILEALGDDNCQGEKMDVETAIRLLRFERSERYPELPGFLKMRDAMEMAINALERTRWISVDERQPDDGAVVIVGARHNIAGHTFWEKCVACWDSDTATFYLIDCDKRLTVEYWMQLPEVEP